MNMKFIKVVYRYSFWVLSAILLYFSFPDKGIPFLGLVSLVPAIYRTYKDGYISVLMGTLIFSIVFWLLTVDWFTSFHPLALFGILIPLYLYTMFPFVVLAMISKVHPKPISLITFPFLWAGIEFLRGSGFWSLPLIYLAHTQYHFIFSDNLIFKLVNGAIPSYANTIGVFGVSILVALVNTLVTIQIVKLKEGISIKSFIPSLVVLAIILGGVVNFYSIIEWYNKEEAKAEKVKFGLIQPNFSPWDKLLAGDFEKLNEVKELFSKASKEADVVVSCESILRDPVNYYVSRGRRFGIEAMSISRIIKKPIVLTFPYLEIYVTNTFVDIKGKKIPISQEIYDYYNAALLLDEEGKELARYFKVHTVPFGEWTPFAEYVPYLRETINAIVGGDLKPGKEFVIFSIQVKRVGGPTVIINAAPIICFEDLYPYITKRYSLMGAQILMNMTNDGWANSIKSQKQHLVASAYRVLETGRPLLRATNTGTTAIIYPNMSIKVIDDFKKSYLVGEVPIINKEITTPFMKFGDTIINILIMVCFVLSISTVCINVQRLR